MWEAFVGAFLASNSTAVVQPPSRREFGGRSNGDWVARNERMPAANVRTASAQWRAFVAASAPYSSVAGHFSGRGIVMTGGGAKYTVTSYLAVSMLRRAGCALPVEMWCFQEELPTAEMEAAFRALGVTIRSLDELQARLDADSDSDSDSDSESALPGEPQDGASSAVLHDGADGFGYVMKAVVLLFSSFEEILYLDTDNIVVRDPSDLFESGGYARTGMLLWPDYWPQSVAPDFYAIAAEASPLEGTVETGQMVVDKRRCWAALQLALFLNLQGSLYYNLLTNYLGVGDKETFPAAMSMLRQPYAVVPYPTGSAGRRVKPMIEGHAHALASICMVQHHPETGLPLFFHNNLAKFDMDVPSDFRWYQRLWQARAAARGTWGTAARQAGARSAEGRRPRRR